MKFLAFRDTMLSNIINKLTILSSCYLYYYLYVYSSYKFIYLNQKIDRNIDREQ